jgi:hypothetical protein
LIVVAPAFDRRCSDLAQEAQIAARRILRRELDVFAVAARVATAGRDLRQATARA